MALWQSLVPARFGFIKLDGSKTVSVNEEEVAESSPVRGRLISPSQTSITIVLAEGESLIDASAYDLTGKHTPLKFADHTVFIETLSFGFYQVAVTTTAGVIHIPMIVQR